MRRICILLLVIFFVYSVSTAWPQESAQPKPQIITFDVLGAGTGVGQGTTPNGITATGAIVGWYLDAANVSHGFVRTPGGRVMTFDDPHAAPGRGTKSFGMNTQGIITGFTINPNTVGQIHGFVRSLDGKFTEFDAPAAGSGVEQGTWGASINDAGTIAGAYTDANYVDHVILRAPDGKLTIFDAPGAGTTGQFQGTEVPTFYGLTPMGAITGWSTDDNNVYHGFVRAPGGELTTFDDPYAGAGPNQGTQPLCMNSEGAVVGVYYDAGYIGHGFLRDSDGKMTTFDAPGALYGTFITSNNMAGAITGFYADSSGNVHGFLRTPDGRIKEFDAPGAIYGTYAVGNNSAGAVTGYYVDSGGVSHGFVMIP